MYFQNGCTKVVNKLPVVQFLSEIILVISNQTCAAHFFNLEIMHMISDQIALHTVQLPFSNLPQLLTGLEKKTMHEIYQSHALYKELMQF